MLFRSQVVTDFIRALATVDEKMVILLDIDRLLNIDEVSTAIAH